MSEDGPDRATAPDTVRKFRFTTDDLPARHQFDAFRAQVGAGYDVSPIGDVRGGYHVEQSRVALDRLTLTNRWRPESVAIRRAGNIRRDQNDSIMVACLLSGANLVECDDSEHQLGPGMLWIRDMASPVQARTQGSHTVYLMIPRRVMTGLVGDPRALHAQVLQTGIAHLFMDHMVSLARNLDNIAVSQAPQVAEMTELLLAATLNATRDTVMQAAKPLDELLRSRAARFIERNLLSPSLGPDAVAAAIGVSRRKLYQVFESSGGVMREIQARRLDRARLALSDPRRPAKVKEVAFSHGFESEAHFARNFKMRFGLTPSQARDVDQLSAGASFGQLPAGQGR